MSGTGNVAQTVECSECLGARQIKVVHPKTFVVEVVQCPSCHGNGTITTLRKGVTHG